MLTVYDLVDRVENGPSCSEKTFDLEILYPKIKELIKKYNLHYTPDAIIPSDDELVDNFYNAGLELAETVGLWCISTERRILVSKKELLMAAHQLPETLMLGLGKDARPMHSRRISDKKPPLTIVGPTGAPASAAIFFPLELSYCVNGQPDVLSSPGIMDGLRGQIAKTNSLIEAHFAKTEVRWLREIANQIGRPGMHIFGGGATVVTNIGSIATTRPDLKRPSDVCGTAIMNEMKTDYDRLSKVVHNADYGSPIRSLQDPIIGGLAGGPDGATLVCIAEILLGGVVNNADYHTINPIHRKTLATSSRMCLWLESMVGQAFARNNPKIKVTGAHFPSAGPGEKMLLQEIAANSITATVSGLHVGTGPASAQSKHLDHLSGLEGNLMCDVGLATAITGWTRSEANEVVMWLESQYGKRQANPPIGQRFQEVYDLTTVKPVKSWQQKYDEIFKELEQKGLQFIG